MSRYFENIGSGREKAGYRLTLLKGRSGYTIEREYGSIGKLHKYLPYPSSSDKNNTFNTYSSAVKYFEHETTNRFNHGYKLVRSKFSPRKKRRKSKPNRQLDSLMLKVATNLSTICDAQERFKRAIRTVWTKHTATFVGYPGGSQRKVFHWSPIDSAWAVFGKVKRRYWNAFGLLAKPNLQRLNPIDVEINFPFSGIDRSVSGLILEDHNGKLFIAYRGRIGGGRRGIGKKLFVNNFTGKMVQVEDGGRKNIVALVGELGSPLFCQQLLNFIFEVKRIKNLSQSSVQNIKKKHQFRPEYTGLKDITLATTNISAECNHGLIVNALEAALRRKNLNVYNDSHRDIYVVDKAGMVNMIFEVKTDFSPSSIYSAIGQLFFNSSDLNPKPRLFFVAPYTPNRCISLRLKEMGINYFSCKWNRGQAIFPKLTKVI